MYSMVAEGAGHAADPQLHVLLDRVGHVPADHHVRDGEAAAGLEHTERLAQHAVLVAGEVDDAIGNDHVDRVVRQRDVLDLALQERHVLEAALALVLLGDGEHLVGHVEAERSSGGSDAARGQQHVDAAAGAQVEDGFTRLQLGECGRIAAPERGLEREIGDFALLARIVEVRGDRIAAGLERGRAAATRAPRAGLGAQRRLAVLFPDDILHVRRTHGVSFTCRGPQSSWARRLCSACSTRRRESRAALRAPPRWRGSA